jgi:hypothetical protein
MSTNYYQNAVRLRYEVGNMLGDLARRTTLPGAHLRHGVSLPTEALKSFLKRFNGYHIRATFDGVWEDKK